MSNPTPAVNPPVQPTPPAPAPTTPVVVTLNLTADQAAALQSMQGAGSKAIGAALSGFVAQRVNNKRQQALRRLHLLTEAQLDALMATLPTPPPGSY